MVAPFDLPIKDFKEHNDDTSAHFGIIMSEENMNLARQEGLDKKFKLTTTISTSNMHLFDPKGVIKKYDTPEQILEDFFHLRLEYYEKRKKTLVDNLELDLLKLDNKVRFILGVVGGEIIVNNRKRAELFLELQRKGFTPFPKKGKGAEIAVAGAVDEADDNEERAEVVAQGVRASDYEYLLSLSIGTLTLEKVQQLCAEKEKLEFEVAELKKASPKSLWIKDLDAFEIAYDEHEKRAEEVRNEVKVKGRATTTTAKAAPKKPRKINFNKANAEPSTGSDGAQVAKPRAGQKKAAAKKAVVVESDEDEEILELKDRLAAHNIDDSSPDQTDAMDTEAAEEVPKKKAPARKAAARKKQPTFDETSDDEAGEDKIAAIDVDDDDDDDDFAMEDSAPKAKKGGGRKPAANKPPKPAAAPKAPRKRTAAPKAAAEAAPKKGLLSQTLITDVLKPAENVVSSPDKKVRKMRASPFNKKSGSILGRIGSSSADNSESSGGSSGKTDESTGIAKARPVRERRAQVKYVQSDSESEEEEPATEDSDFQDDDE